MSSESQDMAGSNEELESSGAAAAIPERRICSVQKNSALVRYENREGKFRISPRPVTTFDVSDAHLIPTDTEKGLKPSEGILLVTMLELLCQNEKDPNQAKKAFNKAVKMLVENKMIPPWIREPQNVKKIESLRQYVRQFIPPQPRSLPYVKTEQRYTADFKEDGQLGEGGFGSVYKALNELDQRYYAIKKIPIYDFDDSVNKILNEVKTLAALNNQHIVRYHSTWIEYNCDSENSSSTDSSMASKFKEVSDSSESVVFESDGQAAEQSSQRISDKLSKQSSQSIDENSETSSCWEEENSKGTLYIQMELCEETLREWLEKRNSCNKPPEELIDNAKNQTIIQGMLKGVICIHEKEIIHRDLKPANIFLKEENEISAKIGDFGLATSRNEMDYKKATGSGRRLLSQGVGTPIYCSPEQQTGTNYDTKSDIYSLGLIIYEIYHPCKTAMEQRKLFEELKKYRRISDFVCENFPKRAEMIRAMTRFDPTKRPTAKELLTKEQSLTEDRSKDEEIARLKERIKQLELELKKNP